MLFTTIVFGQNTVIISGNIKDADNGETLIGATLEIPQHQSGTTTNEYGFYSVSIPSSADSITLKYSYIGYKTIVKNVIANKNLVFNEFYIKIKDKKRV